MALLRTIDHPLARVRDLVAAQATVEGHTQLTDPDLCIYRYARPTTLRKASCFGVMVAAVLDGEKRLAIAGHEVAVQAPALVVFTQEGVFETSVTPPYLSLSMTFSPERVAHALLAMGGAGTPVEPVPAFALAFDAPLAAAFERLVQTLADPVERRLLAPLAIDEILFRLLRSDAAAAVRAAVPAAADAQRILEAMRWVRAHHAEKLSVADLARRSAMSESHFAHRFRAVARVSPMRYLREVRLERARELLVANGSRAGAVATEVGFESAAHFTREFKRRYGLAPSRYGRGG
jgi:AraC-like DNA-binding protein